MRKTTESIAAQSAFQAGLWPIDVSHFFEEGWLDILPGLVPRQISLGARSRGMFCAPVPLSSSCMHKSTLISH